MSRRVVGWTSLSFLVCVVVTYLLAFLFVPRPPTAGTVDEYVANALTLEKRTFLFALVFAVSLLQTAVFVALYQHLKDRAPTAATFGLVCLPAFPVLSCTIAGLQLGLIAQLVRLYQRPEYKEPMALVLKLLLPNAERTALGGLAGLPYLFLAIPSLLFGWLLLKEGHLLKISGGLLVLNGALTATGILGVFAPNPLLRTIGLASAVALLLATILLAIGGLRRPREAASNPSPIPPGATAGA